jgi:Melibiase
VRPFPHTSWMTDQTRPLVNLSVHFGNQLARCAVECNDWLVEWPPHSALPHQRQVDERGDLPFRTRVAMLGTFGISAPTDAWTTEDYAIVREHVRLYKDVRFPFKTSAPEVQLAAKGCCVGLVERSSQQGEVFAEPLMGFWVEALGQQSTVKVDPAGS